MSTNNVGPDATQTDAQQCAAEGQSCGCPLAKCKCRWGFWLIVLIVLGGAAVYWALYARIYRLDECRQTMQNIAANEEVRNALGQPIEPTGWRPPSARLEAGERDVRWEVAGPKGQAKAHVNSRQRQGEWEIVVMEIVLPDGKKISLAEDGGAPKFEAPKPGDKKEESKGPPPEINFSLPPDAGPGK